MSGGAGEIRLDGPACRTTKRNRDGKLVTYARLQAGAQVDRANRLNEELYGPEFVGGNDIEPRPYMGRPSRRKCPTRWCRGPDP